ncbi:MAG: aldo/keto reductase [Gammaproteobacteria bacterium]|nr:aldo/keto reductase [Gammaproteobacteria bacterium]
MNAIEKRPFGRTGHDSTVTVFGGAALKQATQAEADRTLQLLLEHGVNHIDTAPRYGDSELRVGAWMREHRQRFFLASKTGDRDYQGARDSIRRSLERLQVDQLDLIQLHALYHPDEWEQVFSDDGAVRALVEAREEGLVRFLGVTGHGWTIPAMHKRSLARFDFDSVLMPYNYFMAQNERYMRDFQAVEAICAERNLAVQTIKSIARGPWATVAPNRATWYQPLEAQADIDRAIHWVMSRPRIHICTAGDMALLPKVLDAASRYQAPPQDVQMQAMQNDQGMTSLFGIGT